MNRADVVTNASLIAGPKPSLLATRDLDEVSLTFQYLDADVQLPGRWMAGTNSGTLVVHLH